MRLLITGGAGYIGSHAVRAALDAGHVVTVLDDLRSGHAKAVDVRARFVRGPVQDAQALDDALRDQDAVLHFAASSIVGESVVRPLAYWSNNVGGAIALLEGMSRAGVKRLIFSSTAATYGVPSRMPITEDTPQHPINPYGATKLAVERLLQDQVGADPELAVAMLRYFNVAGCAWDLGEAHDPETHLVPLILQTALGLRPRVSVYGTDYPTPDGTCIRDYVHVVDLVTAHLRVLDVLRPGRADAYNVGTGRGWSVREVVDAAREVTCVDFEVVEAPRRPGDPPSLVTDPHLLFTETGWRPRHSEMEQILRSHWAWVQEHPAGWGS